MPSYRYIAKDKAGKTISSISDASDERTLIDSLHKSELVVISVKEEKRHKVKSGTVKLEELVIFSRQFATMIDSGIPLAQVLSILSEQIEDKYFSQIILKMRQDIEEGSSFSEALKKHPRVFSDLYVNMVKAGEVSGMLDEVLDRLATYLEKTNILMRKIRSSLVYPVVVVTMAIAITTFLLIKVVPTFEGIFSSLGGTLPVPTQILIMVSRLVRLFFWYMIIGLGSVIFVIRWYISTPQGKRIFDRFLLRIPVFGPLFRKVAVAKFARTFSTLIKSGVPILDSLSIVAKTAGNKMIEETVEKARESVREGEPIGEPLGKNKVFPPMVVRMIAIGEQTGKLEHMLTKIADFYDEQVDATVTALTSLIEPMVILLLGTIVGGIVISLFLPIFKVLDLVK